MAKFKKGDRVRLVVTPDYDLGGARMGSVGVVTAIAKGPATGTTYPVVLFDGTLRPRNAIGDDGWRVQSEYLELVEGEASTPATPPTKLSVGARVRVRRLYAADDDVWVGTVFQHETSDRLCVRYDDTGTWDKIGEGSTEVVEVLSPPDAPVAPTTTRREPVAKRRPYAAPRMTTTDEAKVSDDRPAPNGEEFEATMLAYFDESDATALIKAARTIARYRPTDALLDTAIDLGLFAERIKRRLSEPAA